ncbi:hypothetical protein DDD64_08430 [Actinotignum sanguinis]|uniref:hypothetical protein n=1 Tax=Actinotignum sanguinis TaxID=1445614 RepID=UPI000F7EDDC2|nr:hypothetical protein [Actinotignum sanguinis]MDY5148169.1 hypothetical protein [Actinotignum sanguinis]RTE47655.1 hypothetical protein DDD64_08430 [Actinotignum sanguinis]
MESHAKQLVTIENIRDLAAVVTDSVGEILTTGMAGALADSESRLNGLPYSKYPYLFPLLARAELREFLLKADLPVGWCVTGQPQLMGQLMLVNHDLGLLVRVLKECPVMPGKVPAAGHNLARRTSWTIEEQMELDFPGNEELSRTATPYRFLYLWDYHDIEDRLGGFDSRLVMTSKPGKYGAPVPLLLSIPISTVLTVDEREEWRYASEDSSYDYYGGNQMVVRQTEN